MSAKQKSKKAKRLTRKACRAMITDELRAQIEARLWALKGCHDREAMKNFIASTEAELKMLNAVLKKRGISLEPEPPIIPPARQLCEDTWRILGHEDTYLPGWTWTLLREMLACIANCARETRELEINEREKR